MVFRAVGNQWRKRWSRWVDRRLPRADKRAFAQSNIFILPTGMGWIFAVLLVVMLLTGINYQNSLIFLLTFFLGVVFVAAMHQTHSNLSGLELTLVHAGEGHAGETIPFLLRGSSGHAANLALSVRVDGASEGSELSMQHVDRNTSSDMRLFVQAAQRGYLRLDRVRVETRFPFGLLLAWSWLRPQTAAIVYPKPLTPPIPVAVGVDGDETGREARVQGQDHAEMRPWRLGDLSQRVQWKRYARSGDMVIADWQGEQGSPHWLDFASFPGVDTEMRLSYLTAMVLERAQSGEVFGLRLPGQDIDPDTGAKHTQRCLRCLALFGIDKEPSKVKAK
ncbi:DUF58 domain-containing protein [Marinobacter mobilis]|uniref:Uncharacterized conserved protein, DUF58 family, contains vWF domain n=1 Tax=Marinobacter mobilis TaxID=488533 RepID=A0A1H2V1M4_9GAMM|nr:DUF58 domain-containing protein [Marinobacter mobilis]SDW62170.1 Uncharacterized conserved protein, DUF58 family, contains vWF domain [Marinobacter mobilis]